MMQRAAGAAASAVARHHSLGWLDLSNYFPRMCLVKQQNQQQQKQLSKFEATLLQLIREEATASSRAPAPLPASVRGQESPRKAVAQQHIPANACTASARLDACEADRRSAITLDSAPYGVRSAFSSRGIIALWDWQSLLLSNASIVLDRRNALVCLPSGSGKSVAADLLLLHSVLTCNRTALLALPYQSAVHEKVQTYEGMVSSAGLWVESHDGLSPFPQLPSQQRPTLCVCT